MSVEGYKWVKNKKDSRFLCLEDPDHPSAGPYLRFINLTGNWHPNMELKSTRFKQVIYYMVMFFFFSQYFKCVISLNLNALLFILQTAPFHMGTPKSIFFRKDHHLWEKLIDYMSGTELQQLSEDDGEVIEVMQSYIKKSRKVIYLFWFMAVCCNISIFIEPYQKNQIVQNGTDIYIPLFHFYMPFNQDVPPGYYYSMVLQTILGNIMSTYVISWDSLVMSTLIFFAGQLRISRVYSTKIIDPESRERTHANIIKCHRFHTSLVESECNDIYRERHIYGEFHTLYEELRGQPLLFKGYCRVLPATFDYLVQAIKPALSMKATNFQRPISVEERLMVTLRHQKLFQDLISSVMFVYLVVISINIGASIIKISQASGDLPVMMSAILFVFGILTQLLIFYWFSNQVTVESLSVSSGVFESKWITMDAKIQKEVALLHLTTSKRLAFKAGPCNEMSLSTFVAILKTSYSFFTLLKETN